MRPIFMLVGEKSYLPFIFVIPPMDFKVETAQTIETINIIDLGEKSLIGNRKVDKISFSTFLPGLKSNFFSILNPMPPFAAVNTIKNSKDNKEKMTLIVPNYNIFFKCYIENFTYSIEERTGDVDISLNLIEIEKNKTLIDEVVGLYKR